MRILKILLNLGLLSHCYLVLWGFLFLTFCFPSLISAQQPTATIRSLRGDVSVSIQWGLPIPATVEMALNAGDTLRTQVGAAVVLRLSERIVARASIIRSRGR